MVLNGKNILIAVCGSIAAYKIAHLVRLLVKENASVQVIMTPEAAEFITPLTLATLSKNPVLIDYYDAKTGVWNNHVELGLQADLMVIAPCTANTLGKIAHGLCDNLLTATYLSAKCPVFIAPAMDLDMWKHPSTVANLKAVQGYGNFIIPPGNGELASGLVGDGRLAEPEEILAFLSAHFSFERPLLGKRALVTAGPTYEAIDPVRFIGNHSSGKMGYAIATELQRLGAQVTLVSGPTALASPAAVERIDIISAADMLAACEKEFATADIIVMSAAVADYTVKEVASQKIKKTDSEFHLSLTKTTDILASLGKQKSDQQLLIGFALETNNELEHAIGKLIRKNLDFIVLNSMQDPGAGFATDTNKITIIDKHQAIQSFDLKSKEEVAKDICALIVAQQFS